MKRLAVAVLAGLAGAGLSVCLAPATAGAQGHGFALFSELKHGPDFEHFDYVNPAAPKGGTIRQGSLLPFNSTNVMRFPGNTPNELSLTFDSLMVRAQDEPAAFYGLLAEHVEIEPAFAAVRFRLREEARWHDGTPVTAADVAFTFTTLRQHGLPGHQSVLRGVRIDVIDERVVEFSPAQPADWRYVELVATFPIQSAAFWRAREVGETTLDVPLGSGPYRLVSVEVNQRTVLSRDPAYWAAALAVNRGRWNVDRIETLYFRERNAKIEALRAGLLDIAREFNAASWARDYDGPRLARGELVRTIHRERSPGTLAALLFNLRRPPLDDRRVRAALACAFDAHWVRERLFRGVYGAPASLYGATDMAARGAVGSGERTILSPHIDKLPDGVLAAPGPPTCAGKSRRGRVRHADALLRDAGWIIRDGRRVSATTGAALTLDYVGTSTGVERAIPAWATVLEDLGVDLRTRLHDFATVRHELLSHNFDVSQSVFSPRFPPGGAERLGWHSENRNVVGYALAGAADPALDAAIEAIATATTIDEIHHGTRAFDRVMRWQHYLVPLWHRDEIWLAHDAGLRLPEGFALKRFGHLSTLWWAPSAHPSTDE